VFVYDGSNWSPRDTGVSTVAVYHNPSNNMYRVVGLDGQSGQVRVKEKFFFFSCFWLREKKKKKKKKKKKIDPFCFIHLLFFLFLKHNHRQTSIV
jgi:hypothetical protein